MASSSAKGNVFKPASRITGWGNDVWSMVNSAAATSPVQPVINLGQGFFGYNPPSFILDAAKQALDRIDCNQYSPTKGRPRLKKAIAAAYSPYFGRTIDPEKEVAITTGANEGMLSAIMAFVEPGEEVIVFEPSFDQYVHNIRLAGGITKYVAFMPPCNGATERVLASEWTLDFKKLADTITSRTKMIIINSPYVFDDGAVFSTWLIESSHNPVGKVLSRNELTAIGEICVKNSIIILSDEVYDALYYVPFIRVSTLSQAIANHTLTVGSVGKAFYATGWRVGHLIGPERLIKHVCTAHTRICYASPGPQQEAAAVGYEEAESRGFWKESRNDMQGKIDKFVQILDELGLPYTYPQGGYFVLVNTKKIRIPPDYQFPPDVEIRTRDFRLSWFFITELGIAAIPLCDFYCPENVQLAEDYLRFAICKNDDVLELASERLKGLKKYLGV